MRAESTWGRNDLGPERPDTLYCTSTLWRELIPNVRNTIFVSITYIVVVKDNHCSQYIDPSC